MRDKLHKLERKLRRMQGKDEVVFVLLLHNRGLPDACYQALLARSRQEHPGAHFYFIVAHDSTGHCRACGEHHDG